MRMGSDRILDMNIIKNAQPKKGAEVIKKSKTKGIFGFSYFIPVLSVRNKFSSLIVVPVIRHKRAWLSSWTIDPGRRNPLRNLLLICFTQSPFVAKLRKTIIIRHIASEKYIIRYYCKTDVCLYEGYYHLDIMICYLLCQYGRRTVIAGAA